MGTPRWEEAVFLAATRDLQQSVAYEKALVLLEGPHPGGEVVADRDLFEDTADWKWRWKELFDLAYVLYALPREGGTVALGFSRRLAAMVRAEGGSRRHRARRGGGGGRPWLGMDAKAAGTGVHAAW